VPTSTLTESGYAERIGPNILSIDHWRRLLDGELYASSSRIDWATLLKRTFESDVRLCARCGGRVQQREKDTLWYHATRATLARFRCVFFFLT
jgi:hypothetical protein